MPLFFDEGRVKVYLVGTCGSHVQALNDGRASGSSLPFRSRADFYDALLPDGGAVGFFLGEGAIGGAAESLKEFGHVGDDSVDAADGRAVRPS